MGNNTTVTSVALGGSLATIALWLIGFYQSELMAALPTGGEAAIGTLFTALFAYMKEA